MKLEGEDEARGRGGSKRRYYNEEEQEGKEEDMRILQIMVRLMKNKS